MKKFFERLMIILFPIGILYCIGKAMFYRGDFTTFLGCLLVAIIAFIGGGIVLYYNPGIAEFIEEFINSVKLVFSRW